MDSRAIVAGHSTRIASLAFPSSPKISYQLSLTSEHKMFFRTNTKLLRPIHSLLKEPFNFSAGKSIFGPLRQHLACRSDYKGLVALGNFYDHARIQARHSLVQIRPLLENSLSLIIPTDADLDKICRFSFSAPVPSLYGMDGAKYLSHVSIQCQLERLYDLLHLQRAGTDNPLQNASVAAVLRFLMLNEVLALCLAGIAKVDYHPDHFAISTFDDAAHDALRATWFARTLDQRSHMTTLAAIKFLADRGAVTVSDLEPLIVQIFDRDLAISWHRLTSHGRTLNSIQHLYDMVALVAVVAVAEVRGEPLRMTQPDLRRYGLAFGAVSKILQRQAHALATDCFVTRDGDKLSVRIDALSKGLRAYYRVLEEEFSERDPLRLHVGGEFFEKTGIRKRIEDGADYQPRFQVFDGFTRHEVLDDVVNEADVEFIIKDTEQHHYYFIQIKHSLLGERAFFNAIVEAAQNDLGYGIRQLREAKRLLDSNQIGKTLAARTIGDAVPSNSSFILLHNIAQFDFQSTDDGIYLYDWATFRNLLKDAECHVGSSSGDHRLVRLPTPLVIGHPRTVIERLLTEHPAYRPIHAGGWVSEHATTEYVIDEKSIRVKGLGI